MDNNCPECGEIANNVDERGIATCNVCEMEFLAYDEFPEMPEFEITERLY